MNHKQQFHNLHAELHHFYDSMCTECGDFNYEKRFQTCDMNGKYCLVTGGRIKIGFYTGPVILWLTSLLVMYLSSRVLKHPKGVFKYQIISSFFLIY